MSITITQKGADVINTYLTDSSQKQPRKITLAQVGWSIGNGFKNNDGRIEFSHLDKSAHLLSVKDLYFDRKANIGYFDRSAYRVCETNAKGEDVVPGCEIDFNTTTLASTSSTKAQVLMAALYPQEISPAFRKEHARDIAELQQKLKVAGMKIK